MLDSPNNTVRIAYHVKETLLLSFLGLGLENKNVSKMFSLIAHRPVTAEDARHYKSMVCLPYEKAMSIYMEEFVNGNTRRKHIAMLEKYIDVAVWLVLIYFSESHQMLVDAHIGQQSERSPALA